MVSKLEILSRYYQIHLDSLEEEYFVYQDMYYYITNQPMQPMIKEYYSLYLTDVQMQGFQIVVNCFGNVESEGYMLYIIQEEEYSFQQVMLQSFKTISGQTTKVCDIKFSWCNIIDNVRGLVGSHASRINHNEYYVILSYYYQGMAENAILVINEIVKQDSRAVLPVGIEHMICLNEYRYLCNPHNLLVSTRIRDIALFYQKQQITIEEVEYYIQYAGLSSVEIMYLYARVLFPSEFFSMILNPPQNEIVLKERLIAFYNGLEVEKQNIILLYQCLKKYVYIPYIQWLDGI